MYCRCDLQGLQELPNIDKPSVCFVIYKIISPEMKSFLQHLRTISVIGIVGGSDKAKQEEQMGGGAGREMGNAAWDV